MENRVILEIKNLHKSYGTKKVINNVNLAVCRGDVLGFIGPNGASIITADMVTEEYVSGTLSTTLIHPVSRLNC